MPLILLENKIIKYNYTIKGRGDNNIFNNTTNIISGGNKNVIEPRNFIVNKNIKIEKEEIKDDNDIFRELLNEAI